MCSRFTRTISSITRYSNVRQLPWLWGMHRFYSMHTHTMCFVCFAVHSLLLLPLQVGTLSHQPPELLQDGRSSPAVDIYSFGIMMHELFTGQVSPDPCAVHAYVSAFCTACYRMHTDQRPETTP